MAPVARGGTHLREGEPPGPGSSVPAAQEGGGTRGASAGCLPFGPCLCQTPKGPRFFPFVCKRPGGGEVLRMGQGGCQPQATDRPLSPVPKAGHHPRCSCIDSRRAAPSGQWPAPDAESRRMPGEARAFCSSLRNASPSHLRRCGWMHTELGHRLPTPSPEKRPQT